MSIERIGAEAVAAKGWLAAHKWLLLRRVSQISILALFLLFGAQVIASYERAKRQAKAAAMDAALPPLEPALIRETPQ